MQGTLPTLGQAQALGVPAPLRTPPPPASSSPPLPTACLGAAPRRSEKSRVGARAAGGGTARAPASPLGVSCTRRARVGAAR